jgi:hypothetical protein
MGEDELSAESREPTLSPKAGEKGWGSQKRPVRKAWATRHVRMSAGLLENLLDMSIAGFQLGDEGPCFVIYLLRLLNCNLSSFNGSLGVLDLRRRPLSSINPSLLFSNQFLLVRICTAWLAMPASKSAIFSLLLCNSSMRAARLTPGCAFELEPEIFVSFAFVCVSSFCGD